MFQVGDEIVTEALVLGRKMSHSLTGRYRPLPVYSETPLQELGYGRLQDFSATSHCISECISCICIHFISLRDDDDPLIDPFEQLLLEHLNSKLDRLFTIEPGGK